MAKKFDVKVAVTSRGRTQIAASIIPSFYDQIPDPAKSTVSLVVGSGDSAIGGIGTPMIVGVAVSISSGLSDVGLGVRSAAKALGLEFIPVGQEQYDILFLRAFVESERGQKLLEIIRSADFRRAVELLGGYDAGTSGEILYSQ